MTGALAVTGTLAAAQTDSGSVTVAARQLGHPLPGAVVQSDSSSTRTNARGVATIRLPAGARQLTIASIGFRPETLIVVIRPQLDTTITVELLAQTELTPLVVTSTRIPRRLEDEPVRVEVLAGDDVDEKTQMRPGDLTPLLREISGVREQPTSPALGAATFRIQGLPGRYTALLSDGLPLYGGELGGFDLLQIPPIDLRQAEVIKGAATALYGSAALGGVVNLVSRGPSDEQDLVLNQTSRSGSDAVGWLGKRFNENWGYTLVGGLHRQDEVDVNGDGWADLPGYQRAELRPRLYWSGAGGRSLFATLGAMAENRTGGTLPGALAPDGRPFVEGLNTSRLDGGWVAVLPAGSRDTMTFRGALTSLWQHNRFGGTIERDRDNTVFSEATLLLPRGRATWLVGVGFDLDRFHAADVPGFDYTFTTPSIFAQNTVSLTRRMAVSASGRCDAHNRYGTTCSPRVSALVPLASTLTARISAATGFFAPTPLTEETEVIGLARVRPPSGLVAERARYGSLDVTEKQGPLEINGTLFISRIQDPVLLRDSSGVLELINAAGPTRAGGVEVFANYAGDPFTITLDYAYLRSSELSPETGNRVSTPLDPRHSAGLDIAWDSDESGTRAGLEVFYTGRQAVSDDPYRTTSRPYATVGILVSQKVGRFDVHINGENLLDVRQTHYDRLLLPGPGEGGRWTTDEWAPLEGRIVNVGVRIAL